jgi:hypothetical protein
MVFVMTRKDRKHVHEKTQETVGPRIAWAARGTICRGHPRQWQGRKVHERVERQGKNDEMYANQID